MSRNKTKIIKALAGKGYKPTSIEWLGNGEDGGWYINYAFMDDNSDEPIAFDYLWGWSTNEILGMIERLCSADEEKENETD